MTNPGFTVAPTNGSAPKSVGDAASQSWMRRVAETVNNILKGKINAVLPITLRANETTTVIIDARIGFYSALILQPLTADAAYALYASPYVLPSGQQSGQVTLNHASSASVDQNFNLVIIG